MSEALPNDLRHRPYQCRVYRNLRKGCWSIQAKIEGSWRVVEHATWANVQYASFVVSQAGRMRVVQHRRKNVHAWVCGMLTGWGVEPGNSGYVDDQARRVRACQVVYNPYCSRSFEAIVPDSSGEPMGVVSIQKASKALLGEKLWVPLKDVQAASRDDSSVASPDES